MVRTAPFEAHTQRYESWFDRHPSVYRSEVRALGEFLPGPGIGLEIGVGTGRFAVPLGIAIGVDPSPAMLGYARRRGIDVACGVAESLPFRESSFDHVLVVTTICFVDDPRAMLAEAARVLKPQGAVVIGFVDRDSHLGRHYEAHRDDSVFYRDATFYSATEVDALLADGGFGERTWRQTLTKDLAETREVEAPQPGVGHGAFVVVRANKPAA